MFKLHYLLIKERLKDQVPELKDIAWYLNQDDNSNRGHIRTTPVVYIKFSRPDLEQLSRYVQAADLSFTIMLFTSSVYDSDERIYKDGETDHFDIFNKINNALTGYRGKLSDISNFSNLKGTDDDYQLLNTIRRPNADPAPAHNMRSLMVTTQDFSAYIKDYSAIKHFNEITAGLDISAEII